MYSEQQLGRGTFTKQEETAQNAISMNKQITPQYLKLVTGQSDVELIFKLALKNLGISIVPEGILSCAFLTTLDLSYNYLNSVEPLKALKHLKTLILVSNHFSTLDSFVGIVALQQVYLQDNDIDNIEELDHLTGLPNLCCLSLKSVDSELTNPICQRMNAVDYSNYIRQKLPNLLVLDSQRIHSSGANEFYGGIIQDFRPEPQKIVVIPYTWAQDVNWAETTGIGILDVFKFDECFMECKELIRGADDLLSECNIKSTNN